MEEHSLTLRDGAEVLVRPIEPEDRDALAAGFERLSEESRYRRFLGPVDRLGPSMLRYLTEVDHRDHEALVVFEPGGDLIGVARYVRDADGRAEAAVTVADEWQGRGLGRRSRGCSPAAPSTRGSPPSRRCSSPGTGR